MKITKSQLKEIIKEEMAAVLSEQEFYEVEAKDVNEEYCPACQKAQLEEKKRKKPCKKAKGKKFVKRVNGRCRSFGQAGKAKGGGPRIRPGTKKGDLLELKNVKTRHAQIHSLEESGSVVVRNRWLKNKHVN